MERAKVTSYSSPSLLALQTFGCSMSFGRTQSFQIICRRWCLAALVWEHGWFPRNTPLPTLVKVPNLVALSQRLWA